MPIRHTSGIVFVVFIHSFAFDKTKRFSLESVAFECFQELSALCFIVISSPEVLAGIVRSSVSDMDRVVLNCIR